LEGRDLSTRVEWGDQKRDLEDEAKGEKRKEKSEVAMSRPTNIERRRDKQILIKLFGEHIILTGGGARDD
jgi:hypothetical protein